MMARWLLQQRHYLHIRRGPWQMQRLNHWELPFLRFLSVRQSLYHSFLLRWWWYDNFNGFQKNLSQSRLLNTDYSHPSSHVCLRFPSKISPMPPGEAESGVEARSACKHHSTLAGRACVVVYLCCCLSFVFFEFSSVCGYLWDKRDRKRRGEGVFNRHQRDRKDKKDKGDKIDKRGKSGKRYLRD